MKGGAEKRKRDETAREVEEEEDPNGPTFDPMGIAVEPEFEPTPELEELTREDQEQNLMEMGFGEGEIEILLDELKIGYYDIISKYDEVAELYSDMSPEDKAKEVANYFMNEGENHGPLPFGGKRRRTKRRGTKRKTRGTKRKTRGTKRRITRRTKRRTRGTKRRGTKRR